MDGILLSEMEKGINVMLEKQQETARLWNYT